MWTAIPRLRLALAIMAGFVMLLAVNLPAQAADPSAAGLWQKVEDGKPVVWVLVVDHDGIFEGVIAKTFPLPGEEGSGGQAVRVHPALRGNQPGRTPVR